MGKAEQDWFSQEKDKDVEWYTEFVDFDYEPAKDDVVVLFYFEPADHMELKEAVGRIASESSTGTWTTLHELPDRMTDLQATAFHVDGNYVKVAYPRGLWEDGNLPQLLSGIAGNIFGMKAIDNLRLVDAQLPKSYIEDFNGPLRGMDGIRDLMDVSDRPLTGAVPKPKIGYSDEEHAEVGFETWMGGFDFVKDDENLASLPFNKFENRVKLLSKKRDKAEQETGDTKSAYINVTHDVEEMKRRVDLLHEYGWEYCMIDVVVTGPAAVQTMVPYVQDRDMEIHAHRAMHAAFDRNPRHGITMQFLAKIHRLLGVSQIHTGTAVGKLEGDRDQVEANAAVLRQDVTPARDKMLLEQDWHGMNNCFPVASGGLHPGLMPDIIDIYGTDLTVLVSGGIHGHPDGTRAGAKATMQAIDAAMENESLESKADKHEELRKALSKWGQMHPK